MLNLQRYYPADEIFNRDLLESEYGADLYIALLQNYNDNFSQHPWQNPTRAREILNTAFKMFCQPDQGINEKLCITVMEFTAQRRRW